MSTKMLLALQFGAALLCGFSLVFDLVHGKYGSALLFAALTAYNVWAGVRSLKTLRA